MKLMTVLTGAAIAVATLVAPPAVTAGPVQTQSCQPGTALRYYYLRADGGTGVLAEQCSGTYTVNSDGLRLESGSWTGKVTFASGTPIYFCDKEIWDLQRRRVTQLYLSPTRAPWC